MPHTERPTDTTDLSFSACREALGVLALNGNFLGGRQCQLTMLGRNPRAGLWGVGKAEAAQAQAASLQEVMSVYAARLCPRSSHRITGIGLPL